MYFIYASEPFGWLERFTVFSLKLHPHVHGMNTRADRSHVWHMKVLHYTVFKDQEVATASDRSIVIIPKITPKRNRRTRIEARGRSLKAEQCSRYHTPSYTRSLSDGDLAIAVRHEVQTSRRFPQPNLSHNRPEDPWRFGIVCGRLKYVRYSVAGDRRTCSMYSLERR